MHKFFILSCLILLTIQSLSANENEFRIININDFQGDSYLPLKTGQKFIIELEGNPTTGYQWFLDDVHKINKELVSPLNLNESNSADYYKRNDIEESEIKRVGGGGVYHFKFQAHESNSGSEVLTFIYKRPWTNEGQIKKTINLKVINKKENDL